MSAEEQTVQLLNDSMPGYLAKKPFDIVMKEDPVVGKIWANSVEKNGTRIDFAVRHGRPGSLKHYSGEDIPDPDRNKTKAWGHVDWKKAIYEVRLPGDCTIANKGEGQILDDMADELENGAIGAREEIAYHFLNSTGAGNTPNGIESIVADAEYATIPAESAPTHVAVRVTPESAVAVNRTELDDALSQVTANGGATDMIVVSRKMYLAVQAIADQQVVINDAAGKPSMDVGRAKKITYSGIPVEMHAQAKANQILLLETRTIKTVRAKDPNRRFTFSPWEWLKKTLRLDAFGSDAMIAYNWICTARNHQAVITGYTIE